MLNKKGLTLVEVIVSIALMGLIAIAFLPAMANYFNWIVDTRSNITQAAFQSQLEMEKNSNIIKERISELSIGSELDSSEYASMGITNKITDIKLFEKYYPITTFPVRKYPDAYQVESNLNANRKFVSWVGDKRLPELAVPEIRVDSLSFSKEGVQGSEKFEYANYPGLRIKSLSNMFKNPQNSFNRYRHDWYVSNPGFIMPVPDAAYIDEDFDMGRIFPSFPEDYEPIPIVSELASSYAYVSPTERTIQGYLANSHMQQNNPGRHIAYTITPFAKSLKMGSTSTILPLYVYGPKNTTDLVVHLDASVISLGDTAGSNASLVKDADVLYLKNWKNTRPNLKTPNTIYNARQDTRDKMPVIKTTDLITKIVPEVPFQGENDTASVWGRSLGNLVADKSTSMKIPNIFLNNSFNIFIVMKKVAAPIAPIINQPILSSEGSWSLSWIDDVSNPNLSFDFKREYLDEEDENFEYFYPASLSEKLTTDEWYLVELSSNSSKIELKASNLKIGNDSSFEAEGSPGKLNSSSIDINWNGVEIAELLVYNKNIDSTEVTSYLSKKYKALN